MASAFDESEIRSPTRLSALGRAALLDTHPEPYFDRITRLAARLLNSKTALLSLVDSDRQFFKSQCGLGEPYATSRETPLSHSFCKHVVSSKQPLIVADARIVPNVDLEGLVARLMQPYCQPGSDADVSGPPISLRHHQVTPICLFLHELATNSAKYGAFRSGGRVSIRWDYADDQQILLNWQEALTDVTQSAPVGFGSMLLELAARQLGGQSSTAWATDGLTITLGFPLRAT